MDESAVDTSNPTNGCRERLPGDARVIALIGIAHGVSHFFHLLFPPIFPWLMSDFGLSFIEVGATMTTFFTVSAIGQALAGFAVDRFGALNVLYAGLSCFALAATGLASADSPAMLYASAALAGLGNSVFHPADYTVLNQQVSAPRLAHAFSVHGVSGNLGWAAAPVFVTGIATFHGWRVAATAAAAVALAAMLILWLNRWALSTQAHRSPPRRGERGAFAFLSVPAVWLCYAFFLLTTAALGAIQSFAVPILGSLYGTPPDRASLALSAYLLAASAGVILGGFIAQRSENDRAIAIALSIAAVLAAAMATALLPPALVLPLMATVGFFTGTATPSRDLLVRRAATSRFGQAAYGRIYGFVYSGLDTGFALAPLVFGGLMNRGQFASVLVGVALLQGLATLTALQVGRSVPQQSQGA